MKYKFDEDEIGAIDFKYKIETKYKERTGRELFDDKNSDAYPVDAFDQKDLRELVGFFYTIDPFSPEMYVLMNTKVSVLKEAGGKSFIGLNLIYMDINKERTIFSKEWDSCRMSEVLSYMLVTPDGILIPIPNRIGSMLRCDEFFCEFNRYIFPIPPCSDAEKKSKQYISEYKEKWEKYLYGRIQEMNENNLER